MKFKDLNESVGIGVGNAISRNIAKDANHLQNVQTRLMSIFKKAYSTPKITLDGEYVIARIDLHYKGNLVYVEVRLDDYLFPRDLLVKIIDDYDIGSRNIDAFSNKLKVLNNALKIINDNKVTIMEILF